MGQAIFEFLFKYRPVVFERGEVSFASPWPLLLVSIGLAVLLVPTVMLYGRVRGRSHRADRVVLSVLRVSVLALVLFSLFRPMLLVSTVVPQRNFVGVLLDDSRSLRIADVNETERGQFIRTEFAPEQKNLLAALSDRFIVRLFRFSSDAVRTNDAAELTFGGGKSDLGRALDHARQELSAVPLAGLVLVTDGADNSLHSIDETLLALQADRIPVHAIGLGRETFAKDIELTRVDTPRRVLKGTSLAVELRVSQRGYRGTPVTLRVEDDGRIVNSQTVNLAGEGEAVPVRVHFTVNEAGPRLFKFVIPPQPGEMVTQNNEQEALIIVEDRQEKILYFEGEPRFQIGFLRRAVEPDPNVRVVFLTRMAENKYRQDNLLEGDEQLSDFPKTREQLFAYRGLILGSIEASYFSHDQLQMIADFVSQRGGGLLMLGGRRSFAEGGYAGTPVEDVLPVVLEERADENFYAPVEVATTPAGMQHPITQVAATPEESADLWTSLPSFTVVNPIHDVKAGATTLLRGNNSGFGRDQVVLATHQYGRGKAVALTIHDSWIWQMAPDIPLEDQSYETFWQQLLRWLVSGVPDRVSVMTPEDRVAPGEGVELVAGVEDDTYLKVNNTEVTAQITSPTGMEASIPMEWVVERDGEYRASFTPTEQGLYEVAVEAKNGDESLESTTSYIQVTDVAREYYDGEMRASLLQRIAEETGGGFYTPETVSTLAEDMRYTESGTTLLERHELWDMPIVFLLLLGLVSVEWGYRRLRGLV